MVEPLYSLGEHEEAFKIYQEVFQEKHVVFDKDEEVLGPDDQNTLREISEPGTSDFLAPLHSAAKNGRLDNVKALIKSGINVNVYDDVASRTSLHFASQSGHLNIVNVLLQNGANIEAVDINGWTPLHYAAYNGHKEVVKALLGKVANVNAADNRNKVPLSYATDNSIKNILKLTQELFTYVKSNNLQKVKDCIQRGAGASATDNNNRLTPLHYTAHNGNADIINILLKKETNVNVTDKDNWTPLHYAVQSGHKSAIEALLYHGADVNAKNKEGMTALHLATKGSYLEVVELLLSHNANPTIKNKDGKVPLDLAKKKSAQETDNQKLGTIIALLLNVGSESIQHLEDTSIQGNLNNKLLSAVKENNLQKVKDYVRKGEDINTIGENNETLMHLSAENGNLDVVRFLIEKGADFNAHDIDGNTPLHSAASHGHLNIVKYFIDEKGANFRVTNKGGNTPLRLAAYNGHLDLVKYFIEEKKVDFKATDRNGNTPIHLAVSNCNLNIVKYLIDEKGANFKVPNKDGNTPVHLAASNGKLDVVKYLIEEKGADFKSANKYGSTLLHLAVSNGNLNVVEYFVNEKGADFKAVDKDDMTPLHFAAENGNLDIVKFLVDKGADVNAAGQYGTTALHLATKNGNLDVVKFLVEEGDGANIADKNGKTSLHFAAENGHERIVKYLIEEKNAEVNIADKNGKTPLHLAAENGYREVVEVLLKNMADFNVKAAIHCRGVQPLHLAAMDGHKKIVELLTDRGADVNAHDNHDMTSLHWAAFGGNLGVVKFLIEKGAEVNAADEDGRIPLHWSAMDGNLDVVKFLIEEKRANFNAADKYGNTPLHEAANKYGNLDVVKFLLEKGADVNAINNNSWAPLRYAVHGGYLEVAVTLLRHGADINNLKLNQKQDLLHHIKNKPDYQDIVKLLLSSSPQIQSYGKQQKVYLHLSKFISHHFPYVTIASVKQGLYLPAFEERQVKINGKCAAITRAFSQILFLQQDKLNQQDKVLLSNLQTSAELYERLAQGKQISLREEREIFDLSKLLDAFKQQLDLPTSSLPSSFSHIKSYKQSDDLLRYVSDLTGDFAIHLVTSNHVVAIYRVRDIYAYFDSNVAFVSNLKSIFQLIRVLEKAVAFTSYEIAEDGFLVEHFNVDQANNALTVEQKQTLMKPIQTERHLLSLQDQRLGHINLNGKQVSRVTLYDLGTKLHLKGSSPMLINSDINLSSENLLAYLNTDRISITAREYLENLRNNAVERTQELVQTTKVIPFAGSRNEIKHAQQIKELLSSDVGNKLKSYELSNLLKSPIEKSIKALPYYLEIAKTKHWPDRLTNAAGRIQLIRGLHGAAVSCDRERGNTKDCLLNTGEISLSLVSQLIEDKVVQNVPKLIKSLKTAKFGAHILRGGAAIISSPFDVYDIIDSAIDLHNCEKGSNECKDAIAGVTFASTSLASGVVLTAIGAPGVGTAAGLIMMIAQGAYGGGRAIEEFQPYRLTFDENFRLFWHVFTLQPVPTDIEYIKARKDIVSQIAKQIWEQLQNRSEHVIGHVTGLGNVIFKEERECESVREGLDNYQSCTHRKVRVPTLSPSNAVISMDKDNADTSKLARIIPDLPSLEAEMICLPKWLGVEAYEYRKVPTDKKDCYNSRCLTRYETVPYYNQIPTAVYSCDNAMVMSHKERTNQIQVSGNKKIVFDLNLVNQGMIVGSDKWHNDFIIYQGKAKVLGGENTRNTFILTSDSFAGTMFGGKNSTNMLDISNLKSSNYSLYLDNLSPFDRISYVQDYTTNKKQVEEQSHFYGINNVVISANTTVAGNGNSYTFYIKPTPGYSKVNVSKGSIIFPETALLLDCDSFIYSPESNVLSMKFSNFTLDIANYFNKDQQTCNFELIDKHGSVIEPLVDLAHSQEIKLFNLRAETDLTYNNITGWYDNIAKASREYQVYGTVRVKYPIAQERYGSYPNMIFGSRKSDVIPLTKETWYAEGRKGSDSYNVILGGSESSITTEINNYAEDKSLDLLYMPVNSIQAERDKNDLLLYATNSTHPVKVKNYFLGDRYQHLVVINDNKDTFIPLEGPSEDVSLVPFYHPTDNQHIFSLAAEKVASNSEVIVDAKLDDIRFYRDGNDLMLIDDKPLMVKLENFYDKHGNLTLNFWHHNHKDKLSSEQLFELAKLAINYQDEIRSTYYNNVKEYIVSASNTTIYHNQKFVNGSLTTVEPNTKRVGVLALQDPSDIEVSVDNEDLVFFITQNNATFTIKNWNDTDHRISVLKFNQEIEVTGLDKFDLSQVSEIQPLINKAVLSSIATQQLEKLDTNVINGIKYLLAVRGIENGISTYKCLGFDSAQEEQQFISAYHSYYSSEKLNQVLNHDQGVKALVWLIAKGYIDLSLENQSIDRKNDLNKCFAVANKRVISRIVRKLEVGNIEEIIPNMESFIRHHKEALEDKIANSLKSNATNIIEDVEEDNHQRKRRDVRVVKDYKDYVFFNAQNNANSSLKGQQVTSGGNKLSSTNSGSRPSSWINDFVGWVKNSITGFLAPSTEQVSSNIVQPEISNAFVDGFLILSDVGIRKFTGNKYKQPKHDSLLSPKELIEQRMDHTAINAINSFGKVYDFQNATSKVYDKPMTCLSSISLEKAVINMDSKKGIL